MKTYFFIILSVKNSQTIYILFINWFWYHKSQWQNKETITLCVYVYVWVYALNECECIHTVYSPNKYDVCVMAAFPTHEKKFKEKEKWSLIFLFNCYAILSAFVQIKLCPEILLNKSHALPLSPTMQCLMVTILPFIIFFPLSFFLWVLVSQEPLFKYQGYYRN